MDDDGVRAMMTAHWMKQMGWDVAALTLDMAAKGRQQGPWAPRVLGLDAAAVPAIDAASLHQLMQAGNVSVIDLDWSRDYIAGHIPGASYAMRAQLGSVIPTLPTGNAIVFTSGDGVLAKLAAAEFVGNGSHQITALAGGTAAWRQAGYAIEQGATRMATAPDDIRLKAREQSENVEAAMQEYLSWEIELVNQIATDDDQRFKIAHKH